jgi:hypothetical protein
MDEAVLILNKLIRDGIQAKKNFEEEQEQRKHKINSMAKKATDYIKKKNIG